MCTLDIFYLGGVAMKYKEVSDLNQKIGEKIRDLRGEEKQEVFAKMLGINRTTLSFIENGTQPASLEVLLKLVQITNFNIQEFLESKTRKHVIVDTNIIMNCPNIMKKLSDYCDMIYIPKTVIVELEWHKKSSNPQICKTAGLSLDMIINLRSDNFIVTDENIDGKNDDRIFSVAFDIARENANESVYLLTNDKDFKLKDTRKVTNLKVINSWDFEQIFTQDDNYNQTFSQKFFMAVMKKDLEGAKKFANKNINVNYIDSRSGYTPLIQAIRNKDCKMVGYLLSLPQIDVNAVDDKKFRLPPISHAIQIDHSGLVTQMIKNGANVNEPSQSDKNPYNTPLMIAAWNGNLKLVNYLIENGACINQQDKGNGFTALIKATFQNHADVVKCLIDNNADRTICSFEKKTALDYAYEKNDENRYRDIIEILKG